MSIKAMKQALDALSNFASDESDAGQMAIAAYEELRQAIEQAEKRHWEYLPEDDIQDLVSVLISRLKENNKPITEKRIANALYATAYLASLHSRKLNEKNVCCL